MTEDAADRWDGGAEAGSQRHKANCELVASLPELEKQLDDIEKNAARHIHGRHEALTRPLLA